MLCDNCKRREANVRYSENINGRKKEMNLCEECSRKLGIGNMKFNMPIDFSSFLGDFMEDFATPEFMPMFNEIKALKCDNCGYTFDDIANTGRFGCSNCYDIFGERIDPILKRIQGNNRHIGRLGKTIDNKIDEKMKQKEKDNKTNINDNKEKIKDKKGTKLERLQEDLKQAIKEERYEDAAKIRDEIKKMEK